MLLDFGDHEDTHLPLHQKWLPYKTEIFDGDIFGDKFSQYYGGLETFFFMQNNMHLKHVLGSQKNLIFY